MQYRTALKVTGAYCSFPPAPCLCLCSVKLRIAPSLALTYAPFLCCWSALVSVISHTVISFVVVVLLLLLLEGTETSFSLFFFFHTASPSASEREVAVGTVTVSRVMLALLHCSWMRACLRACLPVYLLAFVSVCVCVNFSQTTKPAVSSRSSMSVRPSVCPL